MGELTIIPVLGRKVDVPQDDPTLFKPVMDGVFATHDVGGLNFDLRRLRNACTKSYGYAEWSNSATAQATKCLGLFELYDGTNRDYCFFDNGKFYVYDSANDPQDLTAAGITHQTANSDLVSAVRVGSYLVFADNIDGTTPYAWSNGDANAAKLISAGTEFKFRYLEYFRWATTDAGAVLPVPTSDCEFQASDQLYVPNDDSITGGKRMGYNKMFIYSDGSTHQLVYLQDHATPFRCYTVNPKDGCTGHHSIIQWDNQHFLFNKNKGFCRHAGDGKHVCISQDIETDIQDINSEYYNLIVGTMVPLTNQLVWTVPMSGEATPTHLLLYNLESGQWQIEDKAVRYVDNWSAYPNYTWNDLVTELGSTAVWSDAGAHTWAYYASSRQRLVYANTNGKLYTHSSEGLAGSALDGYRIEPIVWLGDQKNKALLKELWFGLTQSGSHSIDISYRGGDTVGEITSASWTSIGSISHDSPSLPALRNFAQSNRGHQIKWGTDAASERFQVNWIKFIYDDQGPN
jgi:hypothetical protein